MATITLDPLDLAALLCSRVCHDVISPVGAIVNGLEVLEDENDASMRDFALDLIRKSARQASARLQFARLAFGAAGSAGASIDLGDAEQVARGLFHDDKIAFSWAGPRLLLPKNRVKLLLNLVVTATNAVPRGGSVAVDGHRRCATHCEFVLAVEGLNARIPTACRGAPRRHAGERRRRRARHPDLLCRPGRPRGRDDSRLSGSTATRSRSRAVDGRTEARHFPSVQGRFAALSTEFETLSGETSCNVGVASSRV